MPSRLGCGGNLAYSENKDLKSRPVTHVMNAPFGAYPSTYISFSGQFTSRIIPIVLRCIVTCPLFISTIAPIVPMSLLSCTLLFSLVFPRP